VIWAIVSSAFVIYLYRSLNAAPAAGSADGPVSSHAIETELAKLNSGIDAIESILGNARAIKP
jgi:hypothetical protein